MGNKTCPVCGSTNWRFCTKEDIKFLGTGYDVVATDGKKAYEHSIYCNDCDGYYSEFDLNGDDK